MLRAIVFAALLAGCVTPAEREAYEYRKADRLSRCEDARRLCPHMVVLVDGTLHCGSKRVMYCPDLD